MNNTNWRPISGAKGIYEIFNQPSVAYIFNELPPPQALSRRQLRSRPASIAFCVAAAALCRKVRRSIFTIATKIAA